VKVPASVHLNEYETLCLQKMTPACAIKILMTMIATPATNPPQIGLRTSKMKGFLSAVIKNTRQEKERRKGKPQHQQRSVRSTEMGWYFFPVRGCIGRCLDSRFSLELTR
jgi:hypothetical protein